MFPDALIHLLQKLYIYKISRCFDYKVFFFLYLLLYNYFILVQLTGLRINKLSEEI